MHQSGSNLQTQTVHTHGAHLLPEDYSTLINSVILRGRITPYVRVTRKSGATYPIFTSNIFRVADSSGGIQSFCATPLSTWDHSNLFGKPFDCLGSGRRWIPYGVPSANVQAVQAVMESAAFNMARYVPGWASCASGPRDAIPPLIFARAEGDRWGFCLAAGCSPAPLRGGRCGNPNVRSRADTASIR
jgi:hypothetical protein